MDDVSGGSLSHDAVTDRLTAFITNGLGVSGGVAATDALLESGIIDSLGLLDVIAFVEDEYGLFVDDWEVDLDTFGSVERIADFVVRRSARG